MENVSDILLAFFKKTKHFQEGVDLVGPAIL